jgi:S-adenosylmethionine:tRNA-ribosyltransferase-isomerase (queuine synthetase)
MRKLLKKLLKLELSVEDQRVLDALNSSKVASKRVIGRGTLTVNVLEITGSDKFKEYSKQASNIVAHYNN